MAGFFDRGASTKPSRLESCSKLERVFLACFMPHTASPAQKAMKPTTTTVAASMSERLRLVQCHTKKKAGCRQASGPRDSAAVRLAHGRKSERVMIARV